MRRLGEMIAEVFIALLMVAAPAVAFYLAGKPFWPEHNAKMIILPPPSMSGPGRASAGGVSWAIFAVGPTSPAVEGNTRPDSELRLR